MKTPIQTRDAPEAIGTYSQAVRAGDTVYLSGQIGLDPATMQMAEGIEAQTHRVFRNLAAVAAAAGLSLDHAVRMTVYLTDLAHFARVNEIMAQYVREPYPGARRGRRRRAAARRAGRDRRDPARRLRADSKRNSQKLGLRSRFDLVLHLPLRYEDETVLTRAATRRRQGRPVQVEAKVLKAQVMYRPKRQLVVHAEGLVLRFFNFYGSQLKQFQRAAEEGLRVRAFGEVRAGLLRRRDGAPALPHRAPRASRCPDALTPIYPTTAGVCSRRAARARPRGARRASRSRTRSPSALRARTASAFAESVRLLHRPPPASTAALARPQLTRPGAA